jgi:hypothetical protein
VLKLAKCKILTNPALQEKATKEQILVAIVFFASISFLNVSINKKPFFLLQVVTTKKRHPPGRENPF